MHKKRIAFAVLAAFSQQGGIEKFNRAFMKAAQELSPSLQYDFFVASVYDHEPDEAYCSAKKFHSYRGSRWLFMTQSFFSFLKMDVLIIGHLNLALSGVLFKWLRPGKKLVVVCHGIEVFDEVSGWKKKLLMRADALLAVSAFTKQKLTELQNADEKKISVFPNTIDPYFQYPSVFEKPQYLLERYAAAPGTKIIFTLTRLNSNEGYKGHDKVLSALAQLKTQGYAFKYILAGKADEAEKKKTEALVKELNLQQEVMLTGFIKDEEVTDHYLLADVFAMPSKGEGFGIVFIEAMACGLPVIAGNKDGSTEALQYGELGMLVDPDDENMLVHALKNIFTEQRLRGGALQQKVKNRFGFDEFKKRLETVLTV